MPLEMLGKYERLDVLGHGATGIVYLAKDTLLGKQVALKEISAQGDEAHRFLEEARVLDRLRHPNIVRVNSVDEIGGKVVIDMEYVRGRTLQDILRGTPQLPLAEAVDIAAQVCDGLAYAHSRRTVHRDIKPANILVTREGVVKLVDFGLAEVLGTHSFAGGAGTYAYMAPEDFHPEEQSDRQSDLWAVGVVLYEMLAGRRPFVAAKSKDPFAWKQSVEHDPIPLLTDLRPDAPARLEAVTARALARDKADRYRDAASLAEDLRALGYGPSRLTSSPPSPVRGGTPDEDTGPGAGVSSSLLSEGPPLTGEGGELQRTGRGFLSHFATIDDFLAAAPDEWEAARDALMAGALARWLDGIGEVLLAETAAQILAEPHRDDDDRLRDFLYRAGLETADLAQSAYADARRELRAGRPDRAISLLRRAARLDPSRPEYQDALDDALGEHTAPTQAQNQAQARVQTRAPAPPATAPAAVPADRVDFGTLRRGQTRSARVTLQNSAGGPLEGRVLSAPGWVRVEPPAFSARRRQTLTLTARTEAVPPAPAAYDESVILETSAGRREIGVAVAVLPARLSWGRIAWWYLPLLVCAALPAALGLRAILLGADSRALWQPGWGASGLLFLSLFALALAADTLWTARLLPLGLAALSAWSLWRTQADVASPALPLLQTAVPVLVMLVLQTCALVLDGPGWGRWQLWRWIIGATALLASYSLLRVG